MAYNNIILNLHVYAIKHAMSVSNYIKIKIDHMIYSYDISITLYTGHSQLINATCNVDELIAVWVQGCVHNNYVYYTD